MTDANGFIIRIVVLALSEENLKYLPLKTQTIIENHKEKLSPLRYGKHPHDWHPFNETKASIRELLDKAKSSYLKELGAEVVIRTDEFMDSVCNNLEELIEWSDASCIYIIDSLAFESSELKRIIKKIDVYHHKGGGCITPISKELPPKIRNMLANLRNNNLLNFGVRYRNRFFTVDFEVETSLQFERSLELATKAIKKDWPDNIGPNEEHVIKFIGIIGDPTEGNMPRLSIPVISQLKQR